MKYILKHVLGRKNIVIFISAFLLFLTFAHRCLSYPAESINGEIININYQHKIAFTDLTNENLVIGDVVGVYQKEKCVTYLKVIGTSDAVSKLAFVHNNEFNTTADDFNKITVGNIIVKAAIHSSVNPAFSTRVPVSRLAGDDKEERAAVDLPGKIIPALDSTGTTGFDELSENYMKLSKQFAAILREQSRLEINLIKKTKELEVMRLEFDDLENKNAVMEAAFNRVKQEAVNLGGEKDRYYNEAKILRGRLSELNEKIEYLMEFINENIKAYEKY